MPGEVEISPAGFSRHIPLPNGPVWGVLVGHEPLDFFRSGSEGDGCPAAPGTTVTRERRREVRRVR